MLKERHYESKHAFLFRRRTGRERSWVIGLEGYLEIPTTSKLALSFNYEYISYVLDVYCSVSFHLPISTYPPLSASGESFTYRTPHPLPEVTSVGFEISSPSPPRAVTVATSDQTFSHLASPSSLRLLSFLCALLVSDRFKIIFTRSSSSNISLSISNIANRD